MHPGNASNRNTAIIALICLGLMAVFWLGAWARQTWGWW
jgi:hypothetical protein